MSSAPPMAFTWDGDAMIPLRPKAADEHFTVGERYVLAEQHERSHSSHAHYFAAVNDAWLNLPEEQSERFPTSEHLRKWCLIKAGFYLNSDFACSSHAEAIRLAAYIKGIDDYAVVVVKGSVVQRLVAKSQSYRTMDKDEFENSKRAVLDIVASMIQVSREELSKNTGAAA